MIKCVAGLATLSAPVPWSPLGHQCCHTSSSKPFRHDHLPRPMSMISRSCNASSIAVALARADGGTRKDRVFLDTSAAIPWRGYKAAQARFELPRLLRSRLLLGSQVRWRDFTQVPFFGEGAATVDSNLSEYRLTSKNLVGYATLRPVQWVDRDVQIGWLKPSVLSRAGPFKRDRLDTRDVFPGNIVFAVAEQPAFVHRDIAITADTRGYPGRPTRGGLVRAAAADYADRDAQASSGLQGRSRT